MTDPVQLAAREAVHRYHDGTKHGYQHFARSLGYLDWASQPSPFRSYSGAGVFPLYPAAAIPADDDTRPYASYEQLFDGSASPLPLSAALVGDVLRHALGLSAWKRLDRSRWALRVNPSSGNLHPTEGYIVCGTLPGLADTPAVYHYAADRHALELRCAFAENAWTSACGRHPGVVLVALTSIHWREAWKYGERAFRYCQHDLGHAVAAFSFAAALVGWRTAALPAWSHEAIAALTGIDRDEDFVEAEREEPGYLMALAAGADTPVSLDDNGLLASVRRGQWSGRASQLSEDHVEWTFIDEIARATRNPGHPSVPSGEVASPGRPRHGHGTLDGRRIILQRRSAVSFEGHSTMTRQAFFAMLSRVMPGPGAPFTAMWWPPCIHLALFVHRVDGVEPGLYLLARDPEALARIRSACMREFLWQPAHEALPFLCLARGVCCALAARLSCDQAIAGDGFFSLGMIAEFDALLERFGPSFYRHLFWESGIVGQTMYLEAEAAGARATGIGCFYDDPVHETLGLPGHAFQSLYHFTVGVPIEDPRLTTEPGYEWG